MSASEYPKYIPYPMGEYDQYDLKQTDDHTWHIRSDGMPVGTLKRDSRGYFKPGSEARHDDFDTAIRLTIRGIIR